MGLFEALFGGRPATKVEVADDKIWISRRARYNGVRKEVLSLAASGADAILLIAHFPEMLEMLQPIVDENLVTIPMMTAMSEQLSFDLASRLSLDEKAKVDLIVAERHPLFRVDELVIQFAEKMPCRCRVTYHLSLEDAVLQRFSGEWVRNVLTKLGMTEEEAIESRMVSRRLKDSLKKIQLAASGNKKACSAEEWMQLNVPSIRAK